MCKFNLIEAISSSIDPLCGLGEAKLPPQAQSWEFPVLPPVLDDFDPVGRIIDGADAALPDDLQDLFLDASPMVAPSLACGDEANHLLDELLSDPASPPLFETVSPSNPVSPMSPLSSASEPAGGCPGRCADVTELLPPLPSDPLLPGEGLLQPPLLLSDQLLSPPLPPDPLLVPQVALDSWTPSSPSLSDTLSPATSDNDGGSVVTPPPWSSLKAAPPARRRQNRPPRPYDKQQRRQVTEDERRERKKEQNKTAATRYRRKKKEEQEGNSMDLDVLESRNKSLKDRVSTLTRELSYLRHLMQEVLKYKRASN